MNKIKLFIIDDHNLFRAGICELLKEQSDFLVVGEASDCEKAFSEIIEIIPDIVLMDIDFGPGREYEGIEATQRIMPQFKDQIRVIMMTMHDDDEFVAAVSIQLASACCPFFYLLNRSVTH